MKIDDVVDSEGGEVISPKTGQNGHRVVSLGPVKTEKVTFYFGFGWLTDDELFELRQKEPRLAP